MNLSLIKRSYIYVSAIVNDRLYTTIKTFFVEVLMNSPLYSGTDLLKLFKY